MTDEKFIPGPRADYVCTRCETKGACSAEQPWRDLPVSAARCPNCGAKKYMQRLYSGYTMHVSTDAGKRGIAANEMVGPEFDRQHNKMAARHRRSPFGPVSLTSMEKVGSVVEATTKGQIPAHRVPLPAGTGVGKFGVRPSVLGGDPNLAAAIPPMRAWRGSANDRAAVAAQAGQS